MMIMPANNTGWHWHCLARETGLVGHLYSPGAQRNPKPWIPYCLDNGAYKCFTDGVPFNWDAWRNLVCWAKTQTQQPRWAIVPDVVADAVATLEQYDEYRAELGDIPPALAVQNGMMPADVRNLSAQPSIICIGGTTEWKWETVEMWAAEFPRIHMLRVNQPSRLDYLHGLGVESCDGTGWNRGNEVQKNGVERFLRANVVKVWTSNVMPYTCRETLKNDSGQTELWA